MKLLDVAIKWNEDYANSPEFYVKVDEITPFNERVYRVVPFDMQAAWLIYEEGNFVNFVLAHSKKAFGGALTGKYPTGDGTFFDCISGWSSRASAFNKYKLTLPVVDVTVYDNDPRPVHMAGWSLTTKALRQFMKDEPKFHNYFLVTKELGHDEELYLPYVKPQHYNHKTDVKHWKLEIE